MYHLYVYQCWNCLYIHQIDSFAFKDLISIPGKQANSWSFVSSDGFVFHRIIKSKKGKKADDTTREQTPTKFGPAPVGKYRCKNHKSQCKVKITVGGNENITMTGSTHVDSKPPDMQKKYNLYSKLREESTKHYTESCSMVVNRIKMLPE